MGTHMHTHILKYTHEMFTHKKQYYRDEELLMSRQLQFLQEGRVLHLAVMLAQNHLLAHYVHLKLVKM